ncbi:unnamed protein product [Chondrus crispus]|uniref:Uncharacterized protein n=1 Tax=Chondrus crispus TaxID=2769 RepID=R7Q700_CHOCR|nr:unnamed protein product [Chondrus crispus]CDF33151.1 unnamed protein product [Chondrus crispus]|eukprot:XP_005712954.1 unnamed protein product [Chondrus crispus]
MHTRILFFIVFLLIPPSSKASHLTYSTSTRLKSVPDFNHSSRVKLRSLHSLSYEQQTAHLKLPSLSRSDNGRNLTGQGCKRDSDCLHPRLCTDGQGEKCDGKLCVCAPIPALECKRNSDCTPGEVCAVFVLDGIPTEGSALCAEKDYVDSNITQFERIYRGLTWDACVTTTDCEGNRECRSVLPDDQNECLGDRPECYCFGSIEDCVSCTQCSHPDEVCANKTDVTQGGLQFCVSKVAEEREVFLTSLCRSETPSVAPEPVVSLTPKPTEPAASSDEPLSTPQPKPIDEENPANTSSASSSTPPFTTGGLTWDPCRSTDECKGERTCEIVTKEEARLECNNDQESICNCIPDRVISCASNADCEASGEICAERTDVGRSRLFCISQRAEEVLDFFEPVTPSPTPLITSNPPPADTPEPFVCIDARILSHLAAEELIFKKHAHATVLCDKNESCATPAHMVIFNDETMMMKSYCSIVSCKEMAMLVNSPRYRRGMTVETYTNGLQFTSFAARYGTLIEERILSSVIRHGF